MKAVPHPCKRVLVMNDNPDMLSSMRDVLELGGAEVMTTTSAVEAKRCLDAGFRASVLLVDLRLGDGQRGDEFVEALKADRRYAEIPVVLVSGDVHELGRVSHVADHVLVKPFAIEQLFEILSDICAEQV